MYRLQRNRPNPSANAARLAAEAAFSAPPPADAVPQVASNALVVVKKKRLIDPAADPDRAQESRADDHEHAPRVFRVPTAQLPEQRRDTAADAPDDEPPHPTVLRRARRLAAAKSGPVVTVVAPPAPSVDLAALARELEAAMSAREHADAQAQLSRLEAQLGALDAVLGVIAKARDFTLNDTQLSAQWQQLARAAARLLESLQQDRLAPQS